jgi:hypothetical protein
MLQDPLCRRRAEIICRPDSDHKTLPGFVIEVSTACVDERQPQRGCAIGIEVHRREHTTLGLALHHAVHSPVDSSQWAGLVWRRSGALLSWRHRERDRSYGNVGPAHRTGSQAAAD